MAVAAPYGGHVGSARVGDAYPPLCNKSIPDQVRTVQAPIAKLEKSLRMSSGSSRFPPTSWTRLASPLMCEGGQGDKARGADLRSAGTSLQSFQSPQRAAGTRHFGRVSKCRPLGGSLGAPQGHREALLGGPGGCLGSPGGPLGRTWGPQEAGTLTGVESAGFRGGPEQTMGILGVAPGDSWEALWGAWGHRSRKRRRRMTIRRIRGIQSIRGSGRSEKQI